MKRILVTGGAGFIGFHLCKQLLAEGNKVICLDNLFSGTLSNIKILSKNPNFNFVNHDVINPYDYDVDEIYNLACPASPVYYGYNPVYTLKTNVLGMINALELAKKYNIKILQASTSEVYGDPYQHPQKEEYNGNVSITGPRACYDEGKRVAETLCYDYCRQYGVNIRVVRIFNTYGPYMKQDDGRVISNFIVQALKGEDITIYGDGTQTRSFCYVSDLISGLMLHMNSEQDFHGPINLGNPNEVTISAVARTILEMTGSKSKLVMKTLPQDDPRKRQPNIDTAKEVLGWFPKIFLEEGIHNTIDYFQKQIERSQL